MSNNGAADFVVKSAKIYTVETNQPWAQAVAVRGDKITAVGTDEDIEQCIGDAPPVIDTKNRLVLSDLIGSHIHFPLDAGSPDQIFPDNAISFVKMQ